MISHLGCAAFVAILSAAAAPNVFGNEPTCACGYPRHRPTPCERCCQKPVCVQVPVAQPQVAAPQGAFAAPPRTGAVAGESQAPGMTGMAIHFPAFSLRLPTIQLPGFTRFRTDAQMYVDASQAPYVEQFRREYTVDAGPQLAGVVDRAPPAAQQQAAPQAAPPAQSCAQAEFERMRRREYELEQRIRELEHHLQRNAPQAQQSAPPCNQNCPLVRPPQPPPPLPNNVPQGQPAQLRPESLPCPTPDPNWNPQPAAWAPPPDNYPPQPQNQVVDTGFDYTLSPDRMNGAPTAQQQISAEPAGEGSKPSAWQRMTSRMWKPKRNPVR